LEPVASDKTNVDWSIGADNVIHWKASQGGKMADITFSRQSKGNVKNIFAEVCSSFDHHKDMPASIQTFWSNGIAKAYFV
jgi:hypothetical protein